MSYTLSANEENIVRLVRTRGLISRADLSRETGLSKPIVSTIVSKLINEGAIVEKEIGMSSEKGGKKPILLSFASTYKYIVGVDVGGNKLIAILTDLDGNIINKVRKVTKGIKSKNALIEIIFQGIEEVITVDKAMILGVGIGVPGTTDIKTGFVYYMPAFELSDIPLGEIVSSHFGIPVMISNDVTVNALGELSKGSARNIKDLCLIAIGTGTGAGLILNGSIYSGSHNMAGEIGYMITDWNRENKSRNRTFGNYESWFSGNGLEIKVKEKLGLNLTTKEIFDNLDKSRDIKEIFLQGCEHLALGIANIITLLDPQMIILTGGVGYNQYDMILRYLMPFLEVIVPPEILRNISFSRGELGDLGVSVGGVSLIHDNYFLKM